MPCNDCSRTEKCPPCPHEEQDSERSPSELCKCPHLHHRHVSGCEDCHAQGLDILSHHAFIEPETPDVVHKHVYAYQTGGVFKCSCGAVRLLTDPGAEPPLTPEEEEEAPCANESGCYRQHTNDCEHGWRHAADELSREANEMACQDCLAGVHGPNAHRESPPQPDRRPPYLVAYSVQGHLYELALPGDATVAALDGRLVITHSLGPVAGICQIAPITSEESTSS